MQMVVVVVLVVVYTIHEAVINLCAYEQPVSIVRAHLYFAKTKPLCVCSRYML